MGSALADRISGLGGTGMFRRGAEAAAEAAEKDEAPKAEPEYRVNVYAGDCRLCGNRVEAKAGKLERAGGRWTVEHIDCAEANGPAVVLEAPEMFDNVDGEEQIGRAIEDYPHKIFPGRYTVENDHGHHTFRVVLQDDDAKFAPGELIAEFLSGRDNKSDYTSFAFIKGDKVVPWKRFRGDAHSQLLADANYMVAELIRDPDDNDGNVLRVVQCVRCGDDLTNPESARLGIGPVCRSKGW